MAVKSCTPFNDPATGSESTLTTGTGQLHFTVVTDVGDSPAVAEFGTEYRINSNFPDDPLQRKCTSIAAHLEPDSKNVWRVAVQFGSIPTDFVTNPIERKFAPELDFESSREPVYVDGDGKPILSSAGTAFDPPAEVDVADPVIVLTNNEAKMRALLMADYMNAVSTDAFLGAQAGEWKITGGSIRPMTENGVDYFQETWRMTLRRNKQSYRCKQDGWVDLELDEARYEKGVVGETANSGEEDELVGITDASGEYVSEPVKLNGAGLKLGARDVVKESDLAPGFVASLDKKSAFRAVKPRNRQPFQALNLKLKLDNYTNFSPVPNPIG
jgi:hypothetical protein